MKKNWLAILLIAIMSVCVFASCAPTVDTGSGSTGSSTSTPADGDDTTQTEEIAGSGNVMPTFASEGLLKQEGQDDIVLPVLNDTNYAYVENNGVATFTYPKEGTKVWESKVVYEGSLAIGAATFNSVNVNFKAVPQGFGVTFENGMFTVSIDEDVTATSIVGDCIRIVGSKTLTLTQQLKSTDTLIVEAGPSIVINRASGAGALDVASAEFKKDSNITVTVNAADAMIIRTGTVLAFGNLTITDATGGKTNTGINGYGVSHFKVRRNSSRVVIDGFDYGLGVWNKGADLRIWRHASCGWTVEETLTSGDKNCPTDGGGFILHVKNSNCRWGHNSNGYLGEAVYANG